MNGSELLLDLTRRYSEPHRHYHTLEHIARMLHLGRGQDLSPVQVMAIWFHDAIYDPRSDSNEADSAELAREMLPRAGFEAEETEAVARIVLDTAAHRPTREESAPVIDLDLSSLAVPWKEFEANRVAIHREYAWLSAPEYREGLRSFLTGYLARERIFWTAFGADLEGPARANLQRALTALEDAPGGEG
jgi:predicted metal-dependent HD superfamily phosphohydrolase